MEINSILQVIPAVLGYTISGLTISYFVFPGILSYLIRKQEQWVFIISSLFFIVSGFLFQLISENLNLLKHFASEYNDIFSIPIFTILATALGIFLGNTMLKLIANKKERKEIAVIFINTIASQCNFMSYINSYLSSLQKCEPNSDEYLKIYLDELSNNKIFETAFERIGIYSATVIDCISTYSTERQKSISSIRKILLDFEQSQEINFLQFQISKIYIVTTMLLSMLCLIQISQLSSSEKMNNYQKDFEAFLIERLEELNLSLPVIGRGLCQDFVKRLEWLKNHYPKNNINPIKLDRNFYICIIELDVNTINNIFDGNLIHDNYLKNLNNIFSFGESEEEAKNKVKEKLKELIKEKQGLFLSKTTSRDIENYHNQLNANIDNLFQQLKKEVKNITPWQ